MRIAIEGCAHGELEKIYNTIQEIETRENKKVDLLLCCGDFQSTRNLSDLKCMAVPDKYKDMCSFYKYYAATPDKIAPIPTIFIGGNHEASNFLQELPYGGWVAPNIYYLGYAGVLNVNGIRIGGLSGIYKGHDYLKGRFEKPPYDRSTQRSVYHIRNLDVFRLKQLQNNAPDIIMSHDWPRGIHEYGDVDALLRTKPFFSDDIKNNRLGSRPAEEILTSLKPQYWFSAHLHVKFPASVQHQSDEGKGKKETQFLALDKCLPRRKFLQVLDIGPPVEGPVQICYDKEWLSVLKSTNHLLTTDTANNHMPGPGMQGRWDFAPTEQELNDITQLFENNFTVPKNFEITSPPYDPQQQNIKNLYQTPNPQPKINKQTEVLCEKLKVDDPLQIIIGRKKKSNTETNIMSISKLTSELTHEEMDIPTNVTLDEVQSNEVSFNKDEIMLDDESDDSNSPQNVDVSVAQSIGSDVNGSVTKKSKMQLPEPKSDTGLHLKEEMQLPSPIKPRDESDYTTENIIQKEIEKETEEVEKVNEKEEENVNDLQKVAFGSTKKLKRRNVAIYEENDDD